ncbi:MAG TPA: sulfotransferase domain-containing protein [Solimonas sp.]|nr:sulfotransferase domain-containing protein [Solimonas sp.]
MKPAFIYIGPDKSGSSWLYEMLRQHPRCHLPAAKDLYFFDRYYERGWDWYARQLGSAAPGTLVGEVCHDYLFSPQAAQRIAADLPGVRLLTILRDPVERAHSHWLYMRRNGRTQASFEEALDRHPQLIDNGLYGRHLQPWFDRCGRERLGVFWFDQLQRSPRELALAILGFLGLEDPGSIDYDRQVRAAAAPRSPALARLAKNTATTLREAGFPNLLGRIKHAELTQRLYRPYAPGERPAIDPATRRQLQQRFAPDLAQLRELLGAQGPAWMHP